MGRWAMGMAGCAALLAAPARAVPPDAPRAADPQALDCLATAISYEAGNQPERGQEAVAQVVLNRLADPAFPKDVCAVVFQGSERRTGCQFSFTCDGSLTRWRPERSWPEARRIAALALAGGLRADIGGATHYHANYVHPAWATRMTMVARIGAHLFYRAGAAAVDRTTAAAAVPAMPSARAGAAMLSVWGLPMALLVPVGGAIAVRRP